MLFFMVCADEIKGAAECLSRGWTQVGVARFYTPARDDVRLVRRFTDMALLPGGTWLMAARDYARNPEREHFNKLIELGAAKWVKGEEPAVETEILTYEIPTPAPFNPPLSRDRLSGDRRGQGPSRR